VAKLKGAKSSERSEVSPLYWKKVSPVDSTAISRKSDICSVDARALERGSNRDDPIWLVGVFLGYEPQCERG
jgi:hypothetical protein